MGYCELHTHFQKIESKAFMKEDIPENRKLSNRRRLLASLGILSIFSLLRIPGFKKTPEKISCGTDDSKQSGKLLSQDGQLYEVDMKRIKLLQQKISDQELQQWIMKK